LGNLQNGFADIKEHVFFLAQAVDFDEVDRRTVEMPYIPQLERDGGRDLDDDIEPLNLSEEIHMAVENEYEEQFRDIILQHTVAGLASGASL
jgi:hypothetical protein